MQLNAKAFSQKLNHCLDETDAPASARERAMILCKMLDIPRQQAWALLEGHQVPDEELLNRIASEFEVDVKWLASESNSTKA